MFLPHHEQEQQGPCTWISEASVYIDTRHSREYPPPNDFQVDRIVAHDGAVKRWPWRVSADQICDECIHRRPKMIPERAQHQRWDFMHQRSPANSSSWTAAEVVLAGYQITSTIHNSLMSVVSRALLRDESTVASMAIWIENSS